MRWYFTRLAVPPGTPLGPRGHVAGWRLLVGACGGGGGAVKGGGAFSVPWGVWIVDGFEGEMYGGVGEEDGEGWRDGGKEELAGWVEGIGFGGCLCVMPGIWFKSRVQSFHGWVVEISGVCL